MALPFHTLGAWGRSRRSWGLGAPRPRPRAPIGGARRAWWRRAGPRPGPSPCSLGAPSLDPRVRGGCCSAAAAAPRALASGRPLASGPARAAMELEVPEEAESAEGGAVTSEATWSTESGAAAGNGSGPNCTPRPDMHPEGTRLQPPPGPSGPVRVPEERRDPRRGDRNVPLRGAGGHGTPPDWPGDLPWARGRWDAPPGGSDGAACSRDPWVGTWAGGGSGCGAPS